MPDVDRRNQSKALEQDDEGRGDPVRERQVGRPDGLMGFLRQFAGRVEVRLGG